tara:strand:- start:171 stop:1388 length:1218 start_codon:yes stop_codon:yes gene_type:complete
MYKFKLKNTIGNEELAVVKKIIKSGKLSGFKAEWPDGFYGGKYIKKFENYLKKFYGVKYAITVNSWTSGLIAIMGSLDIEPGDEVIVSPWTMSATAMCILHFNAIPIFADISKNDYCLDPVSVKKKITKKTKAVITIDIFGGPSKVDQLKKAINNNKIKIISDSAQSPYAIYKKKIVGTNSDIGGYSLNVHKHINTGEGGVIVTNNKILANRCMLLRNHGEAVVGNMKIKKINNLIGYNFRMCELEAGIGLEQYRKLKKILVNRNRHIIKLIQKLKNLNGLILPEVNNILEHNFYILPIQIDDTKIKISRAEICNKLKKMGLIGIIEGYQNIHLLKIFKKRIAYGSAGFPLNVSWQKYEKGICPVAEKLHNKTFLGLELCLFDFNSKDINFIANCFKNVWHKLKI